MKEIHKEHFNFSPCENGGESLTLTTTYFDNGDGEIFVNQDLKLQSYCNCATIHLSGIEITAEKANALCNVLTVGMGKAEYILENKV